MLDADTLRGVLKEIFGIDDKHLVPLDEGWYVPTYDKSDTVGTWVGYRLLSKKPISRSFQPGNTYAKSVKVTFRLSFVGKEAEKLADMTLLWDDRTDVQRAFEKTNTQINYNQRQMFSYPVKNGGLNDSLCWCVDFSAHTFYVTEAHLKRWDLEDVELGGHIITGGLNG